MQFGGGSDGPKAGAIADEGSLGDRGRKEPLGQWFLPDVMGIEYQLLALT